VCIEKILQASRGTMNDFCAAEINAAIVTELQLG
jgi:hypothetical protein